MRELRHQHVGSGVHLCSECVKGRRRSQKMAIAQGNPLPRVVLPVGFGPRAVRPNIRRMRVVCACDGRWRKHVGSVLVQAYEDTHFPLEQLTTPQDGVAFMLEQQGFSHDDFSSVKGPGGHPVRRQGVNHQKATKILQE